MRRIGILIYTAVLMTAAFKVAAQDVKAAPTLAQWVLSLDWDSFLVALLVALAGGGCRTAASLFREGQTVVSALRETVKDGLIAVVTGAVCFIALGVIGAVFTPWPAPIQGGFIFFAGLARGKFIDWLDKAFGQALDIGFEFAASKVRARLEPPAAGEKP